MAFLKINNVSFRGISACVPKEIEENIDLPFYASLEEAKEVMASIGIQRRHIVPQGLTASDLCTRAASKLIEELGWEKESIDMIAFVTQNPDYLNYPNSFVAHKNLGLPESTMCLDFYHGCPGWVVALSSVTSMMANGSLKRVLLLDGDTVSKDQDMANREERPLFGDAGTATALEYVEGAPAMFFNVGSLSEDGAAIIHEHGGFRNPYTMETLAKDLKRRAGTLALEENDSKMDSMDVFSFAITKVPKAIKKLCAEYSIDMDSVDKLVLHQANKLIVENIAKRLKTPMDKVPLSMDEYGNTTSASIPLTIVSRCANGGGRYLSCGFGTGLAWGVVYFEANNLVCPDVIEY